MNNVDAAFPVSDLALARRLELTEGRASASFVDARAKVDPDARAQRIEVAGALAMFDTPASPMTQTFGLGLSGMPSAADLEQIERFYDERESPTLHEVSPVVDPAIVPLLSGRGYRPIELTSVLYRPTGMAFPLGWVADGRMQVREAAESESPRWVDLAVQGWEASGELAETLRAIGRLHAHVPGLFLFIAELDQRPIAMAEVFIWEGVALLAGACTLPAARRQGAQLALTEQRLRFAAGRGCDLAMVCGLPGGPTQRNAERRGFRIAYTRTKWRREPRPFME